MENVQKDINPSMRAILIDWLVEVRCRTLFLPFYMNKLNDIGNLKCGKTHLGCSKSADHLAGWKRVGQVAQKAFCPNY